MVRTEEQWHAGSLGAGVTQAWTTNPDPRLYLRNQLLPHFHSCYFGFSDNRSHRKTAESRNTGAGGDAAQKNRDVIKVNNK